MKNYFNNFLKTGPRPLEVCWWPLDKKGKLYSSKARAWWHIDFLQKNFKDLTIKPYGEKGDILILQKPVGLELAEKTKPLFSNFKIKIFDLSDTVTDSEQDAKLNNCLGAEQFKEFSQKADFFVVNGIGLSKWVNDFIGKKSFVIEDPYHIDYDLRLLRKHQETANPKVVWHGGGKLAALFVEGYLKGNSKDLLEKYNKPEEYLGDLNELLNTRITIFADPSYFKYKKSSKTIYKLHPQYPGLFKKFVNYDIGIAPYWLWDNDCHAKSTNKTDAMMLVGLPVIATPIPENKKLIKHGVNGFLAQTKSEWLDCFEQLKSRDLRAKMGLAGRMSVIEKRSVPFLSQRWRILLFEAINGNLENYAQSF